MLKKIKKKTLYQHFFSDYLYLLAIDKIHLVKKWDKQFCFIYVEIEKVWKKILTEIFLINIFITLTLNFGTKMIKKVGFYVIYKFIYLFFN